MIGLDTNILARYYIQDESDTETEKQHKLALKLLGVRRTLNGLQNGYPRI